MRCSYNPSNVYTRQFRFTDKIDDYIETKFTEQLPDVNNGKIMASKIHLHGIAIVESFGSGVYSSLGK